MTRVRTLREVFVVRLVTNGLLTLGAVVLWNWDVWTF